MIVILNKEYEERWDSFVRDHPKARFCHLLNFRSVIEKSYRTCKAEYFLSVKGGEVKAIFPFFFLDNGLLSKRIISLPFVDNGGFLGEYNVQEVREVYRILKSKHPNIPIEVRTSAFFESAKRDKALFSKLDFVHDSSKSQMFIKVDSEENMWGAFHKHTRNDIRKAEKSGLLIKEINNSNELKRFYGLYLKTMKQFGTPQQSYTFFSNLFSLLKMNIRAVSCYHKNRLLGSLILIYHKHYAYVAFNVSDSKRRELRPNDLLYWDTIKWVIHQKISFIDLGQATLDETDKRAYGLRKFKEKWLSKDYERWYFSSVKKSDSYSNLKKFRLLWKWLPLFIVRIIGPRIASQLGL